MATQEIKIRFIPIEGKNSGSVFVRAVKATGSDVAGVQVKGNILTFTPLTEQGVSVIEAAIKPIVKTYHRL